MGCKIDGSEDASKYREDLESPPFEALHKSSWDSKLEEPSPALKCLGFAKRRGINFELLPGSEIHVDLLNDKVEAVSNVESHGSSKDAEVEVDDKVVASQDVGASRKHLCLC